jgi:outer membrane immunogenic protein
MIRSSLRFASAALALAAFISLPSPGRAADYTPPPAPELRPSDWSGPFIGGLAAVSCMETHYIPSQGPDPDLNGCGWLGGVIAGWNYQVGNWVLGLEGDASWGGLHGENSLDAVEYDVDLFATARARVGWLASEETLIYITGGVAWLDGTMDALVGPDSVPQSDSQTHFGWTVGGGMEHAFTDSFHGRLEYLFASFNDKDYDLSVPGQCAVPCIADLKFDEFHAVRVALTWNFGAIFR